MSTNKHRLRHAVVAAAAVLTTALAATAGPLRPAAAGSESDPGAIEQLARDHNLTQTEAGARIGRQDRVQELASVAARTLGERYGGVWIDHGRGGTIFVGATGALPTAEVDRLAADHGLTGFVRAITTRFSHPYLAGVAGRLGDQLGAANLGGPDTIEVGLRPDLNRVEIALPVAAPLSAGQQRFLDDARRTYGAALVETRTAPRADAAGCSGAYCDTALRGGVGIASDNGVGCTAGFNAMKPDGTRWMLTAGHCLTKAGFDPWRWWWTKNADGTWRKVGGNAQGAWFGGGHADHAVISVDHVAAEMPENWVYAPGYLNTYPITSGASAPAVWGTYVCKTGKTSGRRCGSVFSPYLTVTYKSGVTVKGMVKASILTCKGDSGGPVYASQKAYGLTSGGSMEFDTCGGSLYFTPISTATAELDVQLLLS